VFEQQSWIITSYAVTFAAFLLFFGRVSDLYSAKPVFTWGFLMLGVLNLVISFLPNKYSFFVLRALAGIAGAGLIPASYRLIVHVFPADELSKAFTLYGMSGAVSNVTGTLVAGFIMYIPGTGQMAAWRWFFRILAILVIPISLFAMYLVPTDEGDQSDCTEAKWRRLDLVGSLIMLSGIVLLILGLTLGASYGWKTAGFLVPFLLSWVLFPLFFLWEAYLPETHALVPPKTWKIPNFAAFIAFGLQIYPWWGVNFLALIETFMTVHGEKPIIAAVRLLPQGVIALAVTLLLTWKPKLVSRPRWTILIGMILGIVGYVLMTRTSTFVGTDYWRFLFPGFILGSGGMMAVFTSTNVGVMTSVPSEMSGVAGAVLQVSLQVGSAVGLAIQAGLLTVNEGGLENPANIHASFYFQLGWAALWLIGFIVLYRRPKNEDGDVENRVIVAH
jgi:MFS family permease